VRIEPFGELPAAQLRALEADAPDVERFLA
jgi:hypothetical protein